MRPANAAAIPDHVYGRELNDLYGWWAAIYPTWPFVPAMATVWPVPALWNASSAEEPVPQSPAQVRMSAEQLTKFGSSVDILEFNPNPAYPDFVRWKQGYFSQIASLGRAFILGYEHINATRLRPVSASAPDRFDMNDPYNRAIFTQDVDFMFREIVQPYLDYCVTMNGRAVIYLWNTEHMLGDFAGLLNEIKARYPVAFIGSEWHKPRDPDAEWMARLDAMDGFMAYSVLDTENEGNYARAMTDQYWSALVFRNFLRDYEKSHPGKYRLFIPTFQAAFDDSRFPGRTTVPMYPRTREELFGAAQALKTAIAPEHIYDNYGPMVIYNELFEGAAIIESQPYAAPASQYHGFGLERLQIVKQFFSVPQSQ